MKNKKESYKKLKLMKILYTFKLFNLYIKKLYKLKWIWNRILKLFIDLIFFFLAFFLHYFKLFDHQT